MHASSFEQTLPPSLAAKATSGHYADGGVLPGRWNIFPEHAAASLWSTPSDIAKLLVSLSKDCQGAHALLSRASLNEMLTQQSGGPYGLGAVIAGEGKSLVLMRRGQNIGYQGYLILYPETGQGLVVLTNSDNGSRLADALVARAAEAYGWPPLPPLGD